MKIYIMTLFPEMIEKSISYSIIGRGIDKGLLDIECINIRDFSNNKHKKVDDYPYGGGEGMVMQVQPIYDAYKSIEASLGKETPVIYLSPKGRKLDQHLVKELAKNKEIVLLCGHYEGVDERAIELVCTEQISIGDYVLTGGELPALVLVDSLARLIPSVLHNDKSSENETFENYLLEHAQYTRPDNFLGEKVPEVLLSGNHEKIAKFRLEESEKITQKNRPDLWYKYLKLRAEKNIKDN